MKLKFEIMFGGCFLVEAAARGGAIPSPLFETGGTRAQSATN